MKYFILGLIVIPMMSFANGSSVRGGADGCFAKPYKYTCTVKSEVGDGSVWQETYVITNDAVTPQPPDRLDIGICGNPTDDGSTEFYAWLSINSRKDTSISSLAQIDIQENQKTFNLLVSLQEGPQYSGFSTFWTECKKIN